MATQITELATKDDFDSLVKTATGIVILLAHWPEDKTSRVAMRALEKRLPQCAALGVAGVYSLDVYSLPKIAEELDVTFVPTLMWFNDQVLESMVWHDGVRVPGETVAEGIQRVLSSIAQASIEDDDGYADAWENC